MKKPERQTYFFHNYQGTEAEPARRSLLYSLFLRLTKYRSLAGGCQDSSTRIISSNCNLKVYNALRRNFWSSKAARRFGERAFVIIGIRRIHPSGAIV